MSMKLPIVFYKISMFLQNLLNKRNFRAQNLLDNVKNRVSDNRDLTPAQIERLTAILGRTESRS